MEHKSLSRREKMTEKTLVGSHLPIEGSSEAEGNSEEISVTNKSVESSMNYPSHKLSSMLSQCNTEHDIVMKHAEVAEEAIAGWEKAEAEAMFLKRKLDEVLQQRAVSGERVHNLDAALKECMQQLRFTREDQDQRIHDAIIRTSQEHGKERKLLEDKLEETRKKLSKLGTENSHLSKTLQNKEKLIKDLSENKSQAEEVVNTLIARLQSKEKANASLEKENKILKKSINKKNEQVQSLRSVGLHMELPSVICLDELPIASASEAGNVDEINCSQSWASSSIAESELFRSGKIREPKSCKTMGVSDISLMDDFVEMEKLARESTGQTFRRSDIPSCETLGGILPSKGSGKEFIPVVNNPLEPADKIQRIRSNDSSPKEISTHPFKSDLSKSIYRILELIEGIDQLSCMDSNSQRLSADNGSSLPHNNSEISTDYMVRVFQWKSSELGDVLQRFVHTCNDLLNGTIDLENYVKELTLSLDWVFNHCFSIRDVSSMRDKIKTHFDWDESQSECELDDLRNFPHMEEEKMQVSLEQSMRSSSFASLNNTQNCFSGMEGIQLNSKKEEGRLKQKIANMESVQNDLEGKLKIATEKIEKSMFQLRELEQSNGSLQEELDTSKESEKMMEDQIKSHKLLNEQLNSQLTNTRVELNAVRQKSFSLQQELENKFNYCQELKATCLKLQAQLKSMRALTMFDTDQENRQLKTDWEITTASEKLVECQETILNLGKQLKAMASSHEVNLPDTVVCKTPNTPSKNKKANRGSSLLDQMLAEDDAKCKDLTSPETKEVICNTIDPRKPVTPLLNALNGVSSLHSQEKSQETLSKNKGKASSGQTLAVVYSKRCGGGVNLVRRLLARNRKSKRKSLTMVT